MLLKNSQQGGKMDDQGFFMLAYEACLTLFYMFSIFYSNSKRKCLDILAEKDILGFYWMFFQVEKMFINILQ